MEQFLDEWLSVSGLALEPTAPLFPTFSHHELTHLHLAQPDVHSMIQRRALASGIETRISCHSFRAYAGWRTIPGGIGFGPAIRGLVKIYPA